jgi:hypothetical protein
MSKRPPEPGETGVATSSWVSSSSAHDVTTGLALAPGDAMCEHGAEKIGTYFCSSSGGLT